MTCSICAGDIKNDDEAGWGESAFCTADGRQFIHYECQHLQRAAAPAPTSAAITAAPADRNKLSNYLTLPDAAQLLGISPATLRRRIKAGTLAAFRLDGGQTILIERAALLGLLKPL